MNFLCMLSKEKYQKSNPLFLLYYFTVFYTDWIDSLWIWVCILICDVDVDTFRDHDIVCSLHIATLHQMELYNI